MIIIASWSIAEKRISLSRKKFQISETVKFAGYVVSSYGIKADPNKVATLTKFPLPKARTKLKSFLYLVNQFESSSLTCVLSVELKKLNSTKNAYFWTEIHKAEFKKVKELLAQTTTLDYFDQK